MKLQKEKEKTDFRLQSSQISIFSNSTDNITPPRYSSKPSFKAYSRLTRKRNKLYENKTDQSKRQKIDEKSLN